MSRGDNATLRTPAFFDPDADAINDERVQLSCSLDQSRRDVGLREGQQQAAGVTGAAVQVAGLRQAAAQCLVALGSRLVLVPDELLTGQQRRGRRIVLRTTGRNTLRRIQFVDVCAVHEDRIGFRIHHRGSLQSRRFRELVRPEGNDIVSQLSRSYLRAFDTPDTPRTPITVGVACVRRLRGKSVI